MTDDDAIELEWVSLGGPPGLSPLALDDRALEDPTMMIVPLCPDCRHLDRTAPRGTFRCAAFPAGIPNVILWMDHDHHTAFPGDNGIRFERITDDAGDEPPAP